MNDKEDSKRYQCGGFLFIGNRAWYSDPEDYLDWLGYSWNFVDLARDLAAGCLPAGMVINVEDYVPMVVTHSPGIEDWKMIPITDYYSTLAYAACDGTIITTLEAIEHV